MTAEETSLYTFVVFNAGKKLHVNLSKSEMMDQMFNTSRVTFKTCIYSGAFTHNFTLSSAGVHLPVVSCCFGFDFVN